MYVKLLYLLVEQVNVTAPAQIGRLNVDAWIAGLIAGVLGTVAMTIVMSPVAVGPPGAALLSARVTGSDPFGAPSIFAGNLGH